MKVSTILAVFTALFALGAHAESQAEKPTPNEVFCDVEKTVDNGDDDVSVTNLPPLSFPLTPNGPAPEHAVGSLIQDIDGVKLILSGIYHKDTRFPANLEITFEVNGVRAETSAWNKEANAAVETEDFRLDVSCDFVTP